MRGEETPILPHRNEYIDVFKILQKMQTIIVELLDEKALSLLQQLEQLKILRLVHAEKDKPHPRRQWAGSLSEKTAQKMLEHVYKGREEWERNIRLIQMQLSNFWVGNFRPLQVIGSKK